MLPLFLCIALYEDLCGANSPRKAWYKSYLGMPNLIGFLNFEVVKVVQRQDKKLIEKKSSKSKYAKTLDNENDEDEDETKVEPNDEEEESKMPDYWETIDFVEYHNKTEAENITFKQLMQTHIRYYHPAIFRGLITDSPAVSSWGDLTYLLDKIQDHQVEGVHYAEKDEMKFYAPLPIMH